MDFTFACNENDSPVYGKYDGENCALYLNPLVSYNHLFAVQVDFSVVTTL